MEEVRKIARQFLAKIIQHPITLVPQTQTVFKNYIEKKAGEGKLDIDKIIKDKDIKNQQYFKELKKKVKTNKGLAELLSKVLPFILPADYMEVVK